MMRYEQDMTQQKIAERLGVSQNTVNYHLKTASKVLKKFFLSSL